MKLLTNSFKQTLALAACVVVISAPWETLFAQTAPMAGSSTNTKQDSTQQDKPKLTRAQILKMKIDDLLELPLEEVMELVKIAGVSSVEELINLIVTTASKSEEKIYDAAAIISVITSKEIASYGAMTVMEIIDRAASMYGLGSYLYPNNMISIRGNNTASFNTNVLVLLNGRPMRESYANGYNAAIYMAFPVERIERIEIIRGPGSVLYGTCALTGVINIITKSAGKQGRISATARYGAFNTLQAASNVGFQIGDLEVSGGVNYLKSTGWDYTARGEVDFINATTVVNPKTIKAYQTGVGADLNIKFQGFRLNANYTYSQQAALSRNARWGDVLTPLATGPIDFNFTMSRLFVDAGYEAEFIPELWTATFNVTFNGNNVRLGRPELPNDRDDILSNDVLVEWTNFFKPMENMNIILGGLTNTQTGTHIAFNTINNNPPFGTAYPRTKDPSAPLNDNPFNILPAYNQTWWSAYFQVDYKIAKVLKLIAGGQLNKVTDVPIDFVPRLGVVWSITEAFGAKILFAEAFRSPSAFERDFRSRIVLGNPNLDPEKISTVEGQLFFASSNYEVALTAFQSIQRSVITRSLPAENLAVLSGVQYPGVPFYINRGRLQTRGLELESKANFSKEFSLMGSVTYNITAETAQNSDSLSIFNYLGMPNVMVKLGVNYTSFFGLNIGAWNSYFGAGGDITTLSTRNLNPDVRPYNFLSANISYNIVNLFESTSLPDMTLGVYATNILDEQIFYPEYVRRNMNSIPGRPGRALYVSFTVKF
jgi:outer membrane receptor for ferrienterochelin and colicins